MNNYYYHPIPVGHDVYISHKDACNNFHQQFQKVVHIWRSDIPDYSCDVVKNNINNGLFIEYHDGESFTKADKSLDEIAQFVSGNESLLIHCTAGQTRSPTLAVFAKLIRGATIDQAVGQIMACNWSFRQVVSNLCLTPLQEIFEYIERH